MFLKIVIKYENIEKLMLEILHEFIDKIVVRHKEIIDGETKQQAEIYYKMIGNLAYLNLPKKKNKDTCIKKSHVKIHALKLIINF